MITIDRLREALSYDPETGKLTWLAGAGKRGGKRNAGDVAGSHHSMGYVQVSLDGESKFAHRVAWALHTGEWPSVEIDHRDGDRSNNSWVNLREASHAENMQNRSKHRNNTSGYTGVSYDRESRRWAAQIRYDGKRHRLGRFANKVDAHAAYLVAKAQLHEFQPRPRAAGE